MAAPVMAPPVAGSRCGISVAHSLGGVWSKVRQVLAPAMQKWPALATAECAGTGAGAVELPASVPVAVSEACQICIGAGERVRLVCEQRSRTAAPFRLTNNAAVTACTVRPEKRRAKRRNHETDRRLS